MLIRCIFSGSDVGSKWWLLYSLLHPITKHFNRLIRDILSSLHWSRHNAGQLSFTQGGAKVRRICQSTIVGGACIELHHSDRNLRTAWIEKEDFKIGIKKKNFFIIIGWMFTHTSNTHLCSNNLKSYFFIRWPLSAYDVFGKRSPGLNQERNLHKSSTVYKPKSCVWILLWDTTGDGLFSLEEVLEWIMDSYFSQKHLLMMDLLQLLSSPDVIWWTRMVWVTCGLLWCIYQQFGLSLWRHPFTAKHPLLRHWCRDTFLQIWWRNKLIYILDGLSGSTFSARLFLIELFL